MVRLPNSLAVKFPNNAKGEGIEGWKTGGGQGTVEDTPGGRKALVQRAGENQFKPPAFDQWHTLRDVAVGDHIQAYLNGKLLLDHRDSRFRSK